jgi:dihydrolipoamide dehydrogenase
VILATGSQPVELPFLPWGGNVISSEGALQLDRVPERLVVVGGGYIGVGARLRLCEVRLAGDDRRGAGANPAALRPPADRSRPQVAGEAGVVLHLGRQRARGMDGEALAIETADGTDAQAGGRQGHGDVGRRPVTQGFGLETMGVDMAGPFIKVDDQRRTSMRNVWAGGRCRGRAHAGAQELGEGEMVAEIISGIRRTFDPVTIAAVCFTEPEIVAAGLLPADIEGRTDVSIAQFPFSAIGRALSMEAGDDGGFVRILYANESHRILGIQAVGQHVSELSASSPPSWRWAPCSRTSPAPSTSTRR